MSNFNQIKQEIQDKIKSGGTKITGETLQEILLMMTETTEGSVQTFFIDELAELPTKSRYIAYLEENYGEKENGIQIYFPELNFHVIKYGEDNWKFTSTKTIDEIDVEFPTHIEDAKVSILQAKMNADVILQDGETFTTPLYQTGFDMHLQFEYEDSINFPNSNILLCEVSINGGEYQVKGIIDGANSQLEIPVNNFYIERDPVPDRPFNPDEFGEPLDFKINVRFKRIEDEYQDQHQVENLEFNFTVITNYRHTL